MNAYKFTSPNGVTHGGFAWPLPTIGGPGEWVEVGKREGGHGVKDRLGDILGMAAVTVIILLWLFWLPTR
jgi:hypothetical protein